MLMPSTPEGAREFLVPSRQVPGQLLRAAAVAAALQAAAHGGRHRPLLPDRPLPARRGPARRPPVRVHPARRSRPASSPRTRCWRSSPRRCSTPPRRCSASAPARSRRSRGTTRWTATAVDKPDLRFGMELVELTAVFAATEFKAFASAGAIKGLRVAGAAGGLRPQQARRPHRPCQGARAPRASCGCGWGRGVPSTARSPSSCRTPSRRRSSRRWRRRSGDLLLLVADEWMTACEVLGTLRNDLGRPPVHEGPYRYVWVIDFPMFVGRDADGHPKTAHHPFTHPHDDDLDRLESDPMSVRSKAYDLVLNGWELGSGSIRIHDPGCSSASSTCSASTRRRPSAASGSSSRPFGYGAPPHGGFGLGHRPPRRDPRRRGEHPRGHRVPEAPVRRRPHDPSPHPRRRPPAPRPRPPPPPPQDLTNCFCVRQAPQCGDRRTQKQCSRGREPTNGVVNRAGRPSRDASRRRPR